jgi:hypothetical protein
MYLKLKHIFNYSYALLRKCKNLKIAHYNNIKFSSILLRYHNIVILKNSNFSLFFNSSNYLYVHRIN